MSEPEFDRAGIAEALQAHTGDELGALTLEFANRFWSNVEEAQLEQRSVESIVGSTLLGWQRIEARDPTSTSITLYNPDFEQYGWDTEHTVIEVVQPDMPFLADSLLIALAAHHLTIHHLQNCVLPCVRNGQKLTGFSDAEGHAESLFYLEVDRVNPSEFPALRRRIEAAMLDVRACVEDFPVMQTRVAERIEALRALPAATDESREAIEFLNWLGNDNFVFLGYREFVWEAGTIRQIKGSELGLMRRRQDARDKRIDEQPLSTQKFLLSPSLLAFSRSGTRSTVHRAAYPDYIAVKRIDPNGNVTGEYGFWGLYTSIVFSEAPSRIPVVRRKVAEIIRDSGFREGSFDARNLRRVLHIHPRDELFQGDVPYLHETTTDITRIHERRQIRTFMRRDAYGMFFVCLVFIPRDLYTTELRLGVQRVLLEATGAADAEFTPFFSESVLVRLHFLLRVDPDLEIEIDAEAVQADIVALTRDWRQDLRQQLNQMYGEERARGYVRDYLDAFPAGYRDRFSVRLAAYDIGHLERLSPNRPLVMRFARPSGDSVRTVHLKLYHEGDMLPLSDVVPKLENLGLRVLSAEPFLLRSATGRALTIHDFQLSSTTPLDLHEIGDRFEDAFVRIWYGEADDDSFNRLLLAADLDWRQVMLVRAIVRYLKQIRLPFGQDFVADTLVAHADTTARLVNLFEARFEPDNEEDPQLIDDEIGEELERVPLLNEDRILRRIRDVIRATLRTNFYRLHEDGALREYISFKLNPAQIPDLPQPVPAREIFVHSNRVEGVHLRNGPIARGGLRWSDRPEDYRTEVLGLVKAQVVKNAVIVPTGAKGGFIVRRQPEDVRMRNAEATWCYQTFIRGLLDVTDNSVGGETEPPTQVRCWDEPDPYLVVAADKGTATFSDVANSMASEYDFWLGDAFASGGSNGYDHKKMGITARGAWVSVQRHFRELGTDVQTEPFTVIGIGDMSGDVFGNGMLLSPTTQLIAAFNHLHIFVDPNPDPADSYAERQRLFALDRSSWSDYNATLISAGGGVFPRSAKSIAISAEMRARFDIEAEILSPDALIQALLRAPADLLWNGGIGTWVKASTETHGDADDRSNDHLRINANEVRVRAIGEGGNLGFTQRARVEMDLHGIRINTDFIDNSAGVDCSDHEVNIKILLDQLVAAGDLTIKQRNELLVEMTDNVAELVLTNNYRQAQAISLASLHSQQRTGEYLRFLHTMERELEVNREAEHLPQDEALRERTGREGLSSFTRPELSVMLSWSKIHLKEALLATSADSDRTIAELLAEQLPELIRERFRPQIAEHPLRREIIATRIANDLVHHMGMTFVAHLREFVGASVEEVVRAFYIAANCYALRERYRRIESLDVPESTRLHMMLALIRLGRRTTRWFVRHERTALHVGPMTERYREEVEALMQDQALMLGSHGRERWQMERDQLVSAGVEPAFAGEIAAAPAAVSALPIIAAARGSAHDCRETAELFAAIGTRLSLDWLSEQLLNVASRNHWEAMERDALMDDLGTLQSYLTQSALAGNPQHAAPAQGAAARLEHWLSANPEFQRVWDGIIENAEHSNRTEFSMYSMTCRKLDEAARSVLPRGNG